jgi:competence protein ComEA
MSTAVSPPDSEVAVTPTPVAPASVWRPVFLRAAIGMVAILGLSAIGAVSMLAGLDGAHASPPTSSSLAPAVQQSAFVPAQPSTVPTTVLPPAPAPAALPVSACPTQTDDGRIILNQASLEDLRRIPGVGPKRAEAILALRTKLKRFKRGADLLRVRGIGPKSLARMQAHFVVDPPVGSACALTNTAPAK